MMIRTTTMKRQHVLLNEMILLRSEKVFFFFLLSLSLSLLNCVLQQNSSSSFYEVLYKIWDHFWKKKKRKERKTFGEDTHNTSVQNGALCPYKIFCKRIPQTTHVINRVSQTHWNPTLIKNTKKTKTPNNNARKKKKWCVPSGGKSLLVL